MTRVSQVAAGVTAGGVVLVSLGVGLFDYRLGVVLFGVAAVCIGVWSLIRGG